jgi:uncharacterized protein YllA (UPF0747 family)
MKNKAKKTNTILNLQKETVTILNERQQTKVAGGGATGQQGGPIITIHKTGSIWN